MRSAMRLDRVLCILSSRSYCRICAGVHRGRREGHLRRRAAWRDRRSGEPGADRKSPHGRHRRRRPVPDREPAARHLHGDVHAVRLQHVKREGIELTGSFTATVNADLKVGALEETITVTGETPVVDVQSAQRADGAVAKTSSTRFRRPARYNAAARARAGPLRRPAGRQHRPVQLVHVQRARRAARADAPTPKARLLLDGLSIAVPQAGGTNYLTDTRNSQEVNFTTSGQPG